MEMHEHLQPRVCPQCSKTPHFTIFNKALGVEVGQNLLVQYLLWNGAKSHKTSQVVFVFHFCSLLAAIKAFSPQAKVLNKAPTKVMMEHRISPARLPTMSESGPMTILSWDLDTKQLCWPQVSCQKPKAIAIDEIILKS